MTTMTVTERSLEATQKAAGDSYPDWERLEQEAQALARELLPRLARPDRPALWRRRFSSYATAGRNYLTNRRRHRQGREDLRPLYFIWTVMRACNFVCDYCDDHRGRRYPELSDDGILDTEGGVELLKRMRRGTPSVYFAGGEPTMRKDLPELTSKAAEFGYYPIIVNTNGSVVDRRLKDGRWRSWLAATDIVIVSLDALELGLLEKMWRYRRPEQVLGNLLLLRELRGPLGFKLMVNTVIQPGRVRHAREVLDLAAKLGIWFCPVPMNRGPRVDHSLKEDPEYRSLAELILERKRQGQWISGSLRMLRRLLFSEPLRCRNALKPHVDFNGSLAWPCKASVNVAPSWIDVLDHPDIDSLYQAACKETDPTGFHGPGVDQCGANCNWAQNYSTDAYVHGLEHPLSLLGEVVEFLRS